MDRPLKFLIVLAAVAAAPIPAVAQTWPAAVVASAPRMVRPLVAVTHDASMLRRPHGVRSTQPAYPAPLRFSSVEAEDAPQVELRARAEWSDDQGFRVGPARVAFRRRF